MDPVDPDSDPNPDSDPEHCLDAADQRPLVEGASDPRPEVRVHKRDVRPCELAGLWVHLEFFFFFLNIFWGIFFSYYIQHCFICRPSDSTVPTNAGIEPRTVATSALAVRRLDLIRKLEN